MIERGIYTSPSKHSFRTDKEIKRKLASRGELPIYDGLKKPKTFNEYSQLASRRSKDAKEFSSQAENPIKVFLSNTSIINFIADTHISNPDTDHERIAQEIEVIENTRNSYVIFGGDLIEGIHWGGAGGSEQVMSLNEQYATLRSMFKRLKGKVIASTSGEHDSKWASRTGSDPYSMLNEVTVTPYKRGIVEVDLTVGEEDYSILFAHKLRGNSIYNNLHPPMRASREMQGFDIYMCGHTHRKGLGQQPVRSKGAKMITFGVCGPYKRRDEYAERSGFAEQKTKQLYGFALRLHADKHRVDIEEDIIRASERWG